MNLTILIPGRPVPKGRPRFGGGHIYTPTRTREYETAVQLEASLAMRKAGIRKPTAVPLSVTMLFHFKSKRAADDYRLRPGRPDLDNLVKAIKDALSGIVWEDDSQVVMLTASKRWGPEPHAFVDVTTALPL